MTEEIAVAYTFFPDETSWQKLLSDIHNGNVLPIIGTELATIPMPDGRHVPLYTHLATELAGRLKINLLPDTAPTLNAVACDWLLSGNDIQDIYFELRQMINDLKVPPPQALIDLASITDFSLYVSATFDPLLGKALRQMRPGFSPERSRGVFHPNEPRDLPKPLPSKPFLYHILGAHDEFNDFVVWEEDYIEYVFGLLRFQDNLPELFSQLKNRDLLLIGLPFSDWIVRLFLRVAKGKRFSEQRERKRKDYLADEPARISAPTIFFFTQQVGSTRIIPGDPRAFARELARQWSLQYGITKGDILQRMGNEPTRGAVFISYSSDDQVAAIRLAGGLMDAGVPVWLDRGRLSAGENYDRSFEHAIKFDASFFISLISRATESDPGRYVHTERKWAAERNVDGYIYYIPVIIDDTQDNDVKLELGKVSKLHRQTLPGGSVTPEFVKLMLKFVDEYRISGQPRG